MCALLLLLLLFENIRDARCIVVVAGREFRRGCLSRIYQASFFIFPLSVHPCFSVSSSFQRRCRRRRRLVAGSRFTRTHNCYLLVICIFLFFIFVCEFIHAVVAHRESLYFFKFLFSTRKNRTSAIE